MLIIHAMFHVHHILLSVIVEYNYVTSLSLLLQLQLVLQATLLLIALLQILPLSHGTLHPLTNKMDSFVTMSFIVLQLEVAP